MERVPDAHGEARAHVLVGDRLDVDQIVGGGQAQQPGTPLDEERPVLAMCVGIADEDIEDEAFHKLHAHG